MTQDNSVSRANHPLNTMGRKKARQAGRYNGLLTWATPVLAAVAYLVFFPVPADPVAWSPQPDRGYTGAHEANQKLAGLQRWPLASGQEGPEFIKAHEGLLYTGLSNGDVLAMQANGLQPEVIANTGGRPLGLDIDGEGRVVVADAMRGLLRITGRGPDAKVEPILTEVDHPTQKDPVRYADAVKIAPNGQIWLTDASRRFGAKDLGSTFEASVLDVLEHSCTGRVIVQDPVTLQARVALSDLCFPNGIEFSEDGHTMYLAETGTYRILAVHVDKLLALGAPQEGSTTAQPRVPSLELAMQQGVARVLVDNLPGFPDNLTRSARGRIWVGLTKPRSAVVDASARVPFLRSVTLRLPRFLWPMPKAYGHVIAYDEQGNVVDDLQNPNGTYPETTSATEIEGKLIIQSLHSNAIGWMPYVGPQAQRMEVEGYLEGLPNN